LHDGGVADSGQLGERSCRGLKLKSDSADVEYKMIEESRGDGSP
jgi:hypothetical protein